MSYGMPPRTSPLEQQAGAIRYWRGRGYADHRAGRPKLGRAYLLEAGGELAVRAYFDGWRCWQPEEATT
jgi:hypothetical protein